VSEAAYAAIDTISSMLSLATLSFISALNSPARAPLWKAVQVRLLRIFTAA
jgi:hypothetical protein